MWGRRPCRCLNMGREERRQRHGTREEGIFCAGGGARSDSLTASAGSRQACDVVLGDARDGTGPWIPSCGSGAETTLGLRSVPDTHRMQVGLLNRMRRPDDGTYSKSPSWLLTDSSDTTQSEQVFSRLFRAAVEPRLLETEPPTIR